MSQRRAEAAPRFIGGYQVIRALGVGDSEGGMVLLASSLDRGDLAAIRLISTSAEGGPGPARFADCARSAFAASLVRHPNLARVRGLGTSSKGVLRVVNEFVAGQTLEGLTSGGLGRENSLLAILHTARALEALHLRGLTHGRVHAGNVRYDGLGLFKLLDAGRLPPASRREDATDKLPLTLNQAIKADRLAFGRMCQRVVERLPGAESADLRRFSSRLIAEGDDESYPNLATAIRTLEAIMGVPRFQAMFEKDETGEILSQTAWAFQGAPSARLKRLILGGVWGTIGFLMVLILILGRLVPVARLLGLAVLLGVALVLARRLGRGGGLVGLLRELSLEIGKVDALVIALTGLVVFGVVAGVGELPLVLFMVVCVLGLAVVSRLVLDRPVEQEREPAIAGAYSILAELRAAGLDELAIREFFARKMGAKGRGLFEVVFGERARREAEIFWNTSHRAQPDDMFLKVSDALHGRLDAWLQQRREERLRELFRETEENRLCEQGVYLLTGRRRARRIAAAVVFVAGEIRKDSAVGLVPAVGPRIDRAVQQADQVLEEVEESQKRRFWRVLPLLQSLTGARVRFLFGVALMGGFLVWSHQNELIPGQRLQDLVAHAGSVRDVDAARELGEEVTETVSAIDMDRPTTRLAVPGLPAGVAQVMSGLAAGVAGLLLVASSLFRGANLGVALMPGVLFVLFGELLGLTTVVSLVAGLILAAVGFVVGRRLG